MDRNPSPPGIAKWDKSGLTVRIAPAATLAPYQHNPARVGRILFESNTSADLFVKYPDSDGTYHDPADLELITEADYTAALEIEAARRSMRYRAVNRQAVISTGKHDGAICIEIQRGGGAIHAYPTGSMSIASVVRLNQFLSRHPYTKTSFDRDGFLVSVLLIERGA